MVARKREERAAEQQEKVARRVQAEEEKHYQALALKASLQSKTAVRRAKTQEDRRQIAARKAAAQDERQRAFAQQAEAERAKRLAVQSEKSLRHTQFQLAKGSRQSAMGDGTSERVVSRAAKRAVAKAVQAAEQRAHEELVAAHRQRLKKSGAPVMRGGRLSSTLGGTPKPGKSGAQTERHKVRATIPSSRERGGRGILAGVLMLAPHPRAGQAARASPTRRLPHGSPLRRCASGLG